MSTSNTKDVARPVMSRGAVLRLLRAEVFTAQSKKTKGLFEDISRGWALRWTADTTTADTTIADTGAKPYVVWESGNALHLRATPTEVRDRLREECLTEVADALTAGGYQIEREPDRVVILATA